MKILKPGKVEQRKFVCPSCGCEFVAGKSELHKIRLSSGHFAEIMRCPHCEKEMSWETGEPYEEPTQTEKTEKARLINLLREWRHSRDEDFAVALACYLIFHGVTFKETS